MFDADDIRYSPAEERPPWELSPNGRVREHFSCRKVDDTTAGYCHEVEQHKQARIQAEARRSNVQNDIQRQRAAVRQRMAQEREDARRRMVEAREAAQRRRAQSGMEQPGNGNPPHDPRGDRYIYNDLPYGAPPAAPGRPKQKRSSLTGILLIVIIAVLVTIFVGFYTETYSGSDTPFSAEEEAEPDDWTPPWAEGGTPWRFTPEDEDEKTAPDDEKTVLPRAELNGALTLDIHSAEGRQPLSYQALYEQCLPSTVSITVYTEDSGGTGTGIILTEDGYILTCNHVVSDGVTCTVTTFDDTVYDALLVGGDPQTDLAVLKIDAEGLKPAEFGDSDELTVGDEALAIGDPLGVELRGTLTNGIISAINRNVTVNTYSMTLLQTTAALNSGNSGGPLLNIYGQVVGVNNMKMISNAVTVEGLGFAVPTSVVKDIIPILSAEGKVSRPVLGITCAGIDAETAERQGEPTKGLLVSSINEASNAGEQGLRVGDFIFSVNGTEVVSVEEVKSILSDAQIGDDVALVVLRPDDDGGLEELEITITLVDQADLK